MSPPDAPRWPTFLVIGAARAGTTTLHGCLIEHPQVHIPPIKEPNYFALRAMGIRLEEIPPEFRAAWGQAVSDPDAYRALFAPNNPDAPKPIAFGECSPVYLPVPGVAEQIRHAAPDARLIAILRDPVHRAISHHAHNRATGIEPNPDFGAAFDADLGLGPHSNYARQGRYAELLEPYFRLFSSEQILLLEHDELLDLPACMARIHAHIGADPTHPIDARPPALPTDPDPVPDAVRERLISFYRADTRRLIDAFGFTPAARWSTA